jgi:hypothetical protein
MREVNLSHNLRLIQLKEIQFKSNQMQYFTKLLVYLFR